MYRNNVRVRAKDEVERQRKALQVTNLGIPESEAQIETRVR